MPRISIPIRKNCRRSRPSSKKACTPTHPLRPPPRRPTSRPIPRRQKSPTTGAKRPLPTDLVESAPAKVNLTLRVLGRRADGYHDLESLVAFAEVGDWLSLTPGHDLALDVAGASAAQAGPEANNLVVK